MAIWLRRLLEAVAIDATHALAEGETLVLAPHPDDEVLGCGGTIARAVQCGASVTIVFLTDGRLGLPGPPGHVRAVREAEARRAAEVLGLSSDRLVFLGFEDGHLNEYIDEATADVHRIVTTSGPVNMLVPYRREFHADHTAAWRIGKTSLPQGGRLLEYPIWFGPWLWSRLGWRARAAAVSHLADALRAVKIHVAEAVHIKRLALAAYDSQVSAFKRQGRWGSEYLAHFLGDYEIFFTGR